MGALARWPRQTNDIVLMEGLVEEEGEEEEEEEDENVVLRRNYFHATRAIPVNIRCLQVGFA